MRCFVVAVLLLWLAKPAVLRAQPPAAVEPTRIGPVVLTGSIRSRLENWLWFTPIAGDPGYTFLGNQARLNLTYTGKRLDWTVELAAPILLGLPDNAIAPGAQGQLGMGAGYFAANDRSRNAAMIFPKQAFVRWKWPTGNGASSLRLGRFEFQDGSEVTAKDQTLGAIKRDRVHQRLIGPFVFTHVMRSFDGLQYVFNQPKRNYTLVGALPTRGVFQVDGWGWMKTAFVYASATGQVQRAKTTAGEWRLFTIYYRDWRRVPKQDNRAAAARQFDTDAIGIATFGGHYVQVTETGAGPIDLLALGAVQAGSWGTLSHRAGMANLEAGWQPKVLPKLKSWLRGGYYYGSGDGDPNDGRHSTFFQILPTPRPFARFPFFDMMNNRDIFVMLSIRPHTRVTFRSEAHALSLADRNDLWYIGGGAFQPWSFGYQARPPAGGKRLANLYDLSSDVTLNARAALSLYYGYAQGRPVTQAVYPRGKNAHLRYIELTYRF